MRRFEEIIRALIGLSVVSYVCGLPIMGLWNLVLVKYLKIEPLGCRDSLIVCYLIGVIVIGAVLITAYQVGKHKKKDRIK